MTRDAKTRDARTRDAKTQDAGSDETQSRAAAQARPSGAAAGVAPPPYTVVLTSCGRFDLLRETVAQLLPRLGPPPAAFIVVEDSANPEVADVLAPLEPALGAPFHVLVNPARLGQMGAIDRAYAAVETELVFHCEDDWSFGRDGFIAESWRVLRADPARSMVGLRARAELNPLVRDLPGATLDDGDGPPIGFFDLDPSRHPEYFSYSFNPGLRRLSDYRRLGPFQPLGQEPDVSYAFKKAGMRMANLEEAATWHLGDGRHVKDPTSPDKPKTLAQRLRRSSGKRLKRLQRWVRGDR